jgi:hypothetical protein
VSVTHAEDLSASEVVTRLLASDPSGLSNAAVVARLTLIDKSGARSELVFSGKAVQYDPPLAKSVVRFSAPSDLAGAAFLQIQKKDGDDDRFLFLPELKRARRIAGSLRAGAFMGTDFTFADLDRRDFRHSTATLKGKESIGKWPCHVLDVVPKASDSAYSHVEIWVREGNYVPLRMKMYDRSGALLKTFESLETKRVSGSWFISKARMVNHQQKHTTELALEQIAVRSDFPEDEFSVRALEKL